MHTELLKLKPVVKNYIWGGKNLKNDWNKSGADNIAETWELSLHPEGLSSIEGGTYNGKTLQELLSAWGDSAIGKSSVLFPMFPMLIKFIDTNAKLSVQVHPNDDYALAHENQYGKNEAWYILHAEENAGVYIGLKDAVTKEEIIKRSKDGTILEILQFFPAKAGDLFSVPAGTIHAIDAGLTLVEIQQNSNVTYRIFDHNRLGADGKPRPLHLDKALEVANLEKYIPPKTNSYEGKAIRQIANDRYFNVREIKSNSVYLRQINDSFCCIVILEGSGEISDGYVTHQFVKGNSFFVPASMHFKIKGEARFLEAFV